MRPLRETSWSSREPRPGVRRRVHRHLAAHGSLLLPRADRSICPRAATGAGGRCAADRLPAPSPPGIRRSRACFDGSCRERQLHHPASRVLYELRISSSGGLFDPEYHSYYEDVDLFWWAGDNHIPILFDPRLAVVHHHAGSFAGKYRFRDRDARLQVSIMANYRLTVWKHVRSPRHVIGWLLGEGGYLLMSWRAHSGHGFRVYLQSWNLGFKRAMAIRRRRGRLRPAPANRAAPQR